MNLSDITDFGRRRTLPFALATTLTLGVTGCTRSPEQSQQSERSAALKRADELNAEAIKAGHCERYKVPDPPAEQVPQPDYSNCKLAQKIDSYDAGVKR